jgi:hypothetical protein
MAATPKAIETSKPDDAGKKRLRSPAYPYINLEAAINRAQAFYDREVRNSAPIAVAAADWGYEAKSSAATQTAAALMSFGLMTDEGTGDKRKLKLTQNALKILIDKRSDSTERAELIKQAALTPKIHQQIWAKWGDSVSDGNLKHALIFEWQPPFNENTVDGFIKQYRDTIAFAKLTASDKVTLEDGENEDASGAASVIKVGDYVQWESQGVVQFSEPKRVREITPDGTHALVDGSYTGLPISQLTRVRAPIVVTQIPELRVPLSPNKQMQEFVVPLSDGSRAVFQWPTALSKEDIDDLKDSLKILERKITRSTAKETSKEKAQ